jgi:hypothetical protein
MRLHVAGATGAVAAVHGFDETLVTGEDLDLLLRLALSARVAGVPEPLVLIRRQPESVSEGIGALALENAVRVIERWIAADGPRSSHRRRCNAMLAHLHTRLAVALGNQGDLAGSFRAAFRAIRYTPGSRAAWATWPRALYATVRKS